MLHNNTGNFDAILELIDTIPAYQQALSATVGRNTEMFTAKLDEVDKPIRDKPRTLFESFGWVT